MTTPPLRPSSILALLAAAACLTLGAGHAPSAPASQPANTADPDPQEATLGLHDGRTVTGFLISRSDTEIVLRINGIDTAFDIGAVDHIRMLAPVLDRYEKLKASIAPDDINGRLLLVEWLRSREQYRLALEEVEAALELEPYNPRARDVKLWLTQQIELASRANPAEPSNSTSPAPAGRPRKPEFPRLRDDEINRIRVYEIDLARPPRMLITAETRSKLIDEYASSDLIPPTREGRAALLRARPERVLEIMFRLQARELYDEVRVLENPRSMQLFRDRVHATWLINACASIRCHGGQEAGRLYLNRRRPNADATVYTNFYILDQFRLDGDVPLINYNEPSRSPLLHMAMFRDESLFPHPEVGRQHGAKGWSPIFRSTDDARFRQAVQWIESMYQPRPDYQISYEPPQPEDPLQDAPGDASNIDR